MRKARLLACIPPLAFIHWDGETGGALCPRMSQLLIYTREGEGVASSDSGIWGSELMWVKSGVQTLWGGYKQVWALSVSRHRLRYFGQFIWNSFHSDIKPACFHQCSFTDAETEKQRREVKCPRSQSQSEASVRFDPKPLGHQTLFFSTILPIITHSLLQGHTHYKCCRAAHCFSCLATTLHIQMVSGGTLRESVTSSVKTGTSGGTEHPI